MRTLQFSGDIPREMSARLKKSYYRTISSNLVKLEAATRIFQTFQQEDIHAIPLKGIALIETVYQNPAMRPMTDIDILINPEDAKKIRGVLEKLGYHLDDYYRGSWNYSNEDDVFLDIHTKFTRYEALFHIDYSEIYNRLQQVNFNDQIQVHVLCPEHQLIHIALHLAPGLYSECNFINFLDLYYLINDQINLLDWTYVSEFAKRSGIALYIYAPLYLCSHIFKVNIPQPTLVKLGDRLSFKKANYIQNHYMSVVLKGTIPGRKIVLDRLAWAEGLSGKIKVLEMALFPEHKEMAYRYSVSKKSLSIYGFYITRIIKLVKGMFMKNGIRFQ